MISIQHSCCYVFLPFSNLQSWTGSHTSTLNSLRRHVENAVLFLQEPFFSKLHSSLQHALLLPFLFTSFLPSIILLSLQNTHFSTDTFSLHFHFGLSALVMLCRPLSLSGGLLSPSPCLFRAPKATSDQCQFLHTSSFTVSQPIPPTFQNKG